MAGSPQGNPIGGDVAGESIARGAGANALTGEQIVERLGMTPLAGEGGWFVETYRDEHSTAILYLLTAPDFSALHRLDGPELYHWHAGAPLDMLFLYPGGQTEDVVLGPDLVAGERPQVVTPAGVWQGSAPRGAPGAWTLLGTTMAPGFRPEMLAIGHRAELLAGWPEAAERIVRLTRS